MDEFGEVAARGGDHLRRIGRPAATDRPFGGQPFAGRNGGDVDGVPFGKDGAIESADDDLFEGVPLIV